MKVFEVHSVPESCVQLEINGEPCLRVPTLYDPGSDGAVIGVQTISGIEKKDFTRRKLKIKTNQGSIRNYDCIKVNTIGREEGMVKRYIEAIVDLFRMDEEKKK